MSNGEPLKLSARTWLGLLAALGLLDLLAGLLGQQRLAGTGGIVVFVLAAATALAVLVRTARRAAEEAGQNVSGEDRGTSTAGASTPGASTPGASTAGASTPDPSTPDPQARLRAARRRGGAPWLLIAFALAGQSLWFLTMAWIENSHRTMGWLGMDVVTLVFGPILVVGLLRLPAPPADRRVQARTSLDALAAALSMLVVAWDHVIPNAALLPTGLGILLLLALLVDVVVATTATTVIGRARVAGGLPFVQLLAIGVGVTLVAGVDAVSGRLAFDGSSPARAGLLGVLTVAAVLLAYGARPVVPVAESDRVATTRERVAVLVPFIPLGLGGVAVLVSVIARLQMSPFTAGFLLALVLVLVVSTTLTRLESLQVHRTMDRLVTTRTLDLGAREKWFRSLVQNSSDVITVVDPRGVVLFATPALTQVLGHDPNLVVGTRISGLLRPSDARRLADALLAATRTPGRPVSLDLPVWHANGGWCDTETTVTSLLEDPDIGGLVLNTRDVSERRKLQEQLTRQAYSDGLTGLANRALFRTRVERATVMYAEPGRVAVLFLDLDGFKAVNDTQGHHIGDQLLGLVGKRLRSSVRPGDMVARLGGDEFAILVQGEEAEQGAVWVAERVRRSLASAFLVDGRQLVLGASIGIAVNDAGEESADQLLRNADLAMYRAKARRDVGFVRFESAMHDALLARVRAEGDLRAAVRNGDLVMYYQPIVSLADNRIVGVEALIRWRHPDRGLVLPSAFIDIAEETGLVEDIGRWALEESCRQAVAWQSFGRNGAPFRVAVNVSPRQLGPHLPRTVHDVLSATGLPPAALTLELTEGVLIERTEEVLALLQGLKSFGVRIAVDDFGTGYSSLSYLMRFPVDVLKIDQSFVQHVGADCEPGRAELARTIVELGTSLGLTTVAEGIETQAQRDLMASFGCTQGQGYLFARPLPAEEMDALLAVAEVSVTASPA